MAIDSKRIAKNTIFLYARLLLVLVVTLFTSRVVIDKLGADDFGLYNVVFSVIGLLSFLNGTLSAGTSRFITFALGEGEDDSLRATFSTSLCTHLLLAMVILLVGETIGLWYVHNVMVCPPERNNSAFLVYQLSIAYTMISIIQVPFTSEIMAHEKMNFYAYVGIFEAIAKLLVVFLLSRASIDKMVLYAILLCAVQLMILSLNIWFSRVKFEEVRFIPRFDTRIFKSIMQFSGWNVIANVSNTLMNQGVIMLFNLFFMPVVVAAQAISNQLSGAMMQFVDNVRAAVNPQVIKLYADQNYADSKKLTLQSAEYIFDLLLLLGLPFIMVMPNLLNVWLVSVPEYTIAFARLIIVQNIFANFSAAFYIPMVAANRIKKNSISAAILCLIQFGLLYLLFHLGFSPLWAQYVGILFVIIWSFLIKPYILWKDLNYSWSEIGLCVGRCMRIFILVSLSCCFVYWIIPQTTILRSVLVALLAILQVSLFSFLFMEKPIKQKMLLILKEKIPIF